MAGITYVTGDATDPQTDELCAIAHVCNDVGAYGAGFAKAIAERYPTARRRYVAWHQRFDTVTARPFALGASQWVAVGHDLGRGRAWDARWVVNMVAQRGLRSATNPVPLDYGHLAECLFHLGRNACGTSVHMPRIGCELAGGTWDRVEPLIVEHVCARGVDVTVYDPPEALSTGAKR